ncbi:hypothetical protein ASJ33_05510 [Dehalococcoides mccartyi]|uniref:hypothetical protein n=1 Tax=Dehalococcoides mccartyi TaxID=61435 RepID=UPI000909BE6B|nr:hypothetical protein [Dehalococcoides mccartyi]APH12646.1 hypothetical protein ASJ33_05510 [Dehalococcoides mccartyi]
MYEPSKELIEQIAKEFQNRKPLDYPLTDAEAYIKTDICVQLPTILKALEHMENRPQWQDKPDKEGWWWVKSSNKELGIWVVEILKKDGTLLIPKYISMIGGTKSYLYIPEPEPYKGEE